MKMTILTVQRLFLITVCLLAECLYCQDFSRNACEGKATCHECIQADSRCAWCSENGYENNNTRSRCNLLNELKGKCPDNQISELENSFEVLKNLSFGISTGQGGVPVQVKPQEISLKLRPKKPQSFTLQYKQVQDYPVDLYYLMDLSNSMADDKEKLASLGQDLARAMRKKTSDFRIGYGSFVDKTVAPFVNVEPSKLKQPCVGCTAPYGFKNHMKLDTNTDTFSKSVEESKISGNLDDPEGGFDAIMQAVVCKEEIGWRDRARKLLVFSTDSGFHYAGDGKLGGIVVPSDGNCHLVNNEYSESTKQDYPSISQIKNKLTENNVTVIFAVTENIQDLYGKLSTHLGRSTVGQLDNDSSNVVQLVVDQYDKISSKVELIDKSDKRVKITYKSSCLGDQKVVTNECNDIKVGSSVEFEVIVELTECPKNRAEWKTSFTISPSGLNEPLIVNLEMLCECDCEKPGKGEENSGRCSYQGTFQCGVCSCKDKHFGMACECDASSPDSNRDDQACLSRPDDPRPCFGRGACKCGVCKCFTRPNPQEIISGKYCECDNFSCDQKEEGFCSGPNNGKCVCGTCECIEPWSGSDCSCRNSTTTCKNPNGKGEICSGHGTCDCGKCKCDDQGEEQYTGQYCEECTNCPGKCNQFRDCIFCLNTKEESKRSECECNPQPVPFAEDEGPEREETLCIFKDDDGCKHTFIYREMADGSFHVRMKQGRECPEVNVLAVVLGVVGGIVAIGLLTLVIWKVVTFLHDRREYAKFLESTRNVRWQKEQNPIFKPPISVHPNPTYGKVE